MSEWSPGPALAAYHAGVMVIGELAAQFTEETWAGPTAWPEWRATDLAGPGPGTPAAVSGGWRGLLRASGRLPH
jgi:hypothetical protein